MVTIAVPGRFESGARLFTTVTRGLDPRVHLLRIDFAKMMDARVKPAHDNRVDQIDREPLIDRPVKPGDDSKMGVRLIGNRERS